MLPAEACGVIWLFGAPSFDQLVEVGLINHHGRDAFCRLGSFFLAASTGEIANLYGRSSARRSPTVYCALKRRIVRLGIRQQVLHCNPRRRAVRSGRASRQAGFRNTTCASARYARSVGTVTRAAGPPCTSPSTGDQTRPARRQPISCPGPGSAGLPAHIVRLPGRPRSQQLLSSPAPAPPILPPAPGSGPAMKFSAAWRPSAPASASALARAR